MNIPILNWTNVFILLLLAILIGANMVLTGLYGFAANSSGRNRTSAQFFFIVDLIVFIALLVWIAINLYARRRIKLKV